MSQKRFWLRLLAVLLPVVTVLFWYWQASNPGVRFRKLKAIFQEEYVIFSDSINETESIEWFKRETFITSYQNALLQIDRSKLKPAQQKEWNRIKQILEARQEDLNRFYADAALYDIGKYLKPILKDSTLTLNQKCAKLEIKLQEAKEYYQDAKKSLRLLPAKENLKLAINNQILTLRFLQKELIDFLHQAALDKLQQETILWHTSTAKIAVKDYIAFCRSILFEQQQDSTLFKQ